MFRARQKCVVHRSTGYLAASIRCCHWSEVHSGLNTPFTAVMLGSAMTGEWKAWIGLIPSPAVHFISMVSVNDVDRHVRTEDMLID